MTITPTSIVWSFLITVAGGRKPRPKTLAALRSFLADRHAVIMVSGTTVSLSFTVTGANAVDAIADGMATFHAATEVAGFDTAAARCEVQVRTREEVIEEMTLALPEWMGVAEAAEELGVSRQRVSQLARDHPQFPRPLARLSATPVWAAEEIRQFAKSRQVGAVH